MRRVVITGMGIVSPLGDSLAEVLTSLREGHSGVRFYESYRDIGLRAQIGSFTRIDVKQHLDKKNLRFMGNAAAYASIALSQAIAESLGGRLEAGNRPEGGAVFTLILNAVPPEE